VEIEATLVLGWVLGCFAVMVAGAIWMVVKVFQDSIGKGFRWLLIPFYAFFYLAGHWEEMKKPFWVWLGGAVAYLGSALLLSVSGF